MADAYNSNFEMNATDEENEATLKSLAPAVPCANDSNDSITSILKISL